MSKALTVLAVDDEAPALDELAYLLERHSDIGKVVRAGDATSALRELSQRPTDAIFLDINMPNLSGIELAGVLGNFSQRPAIVFVTAHDDKAVAAFDVGALDYLLKPIRQDRHYSDNFSSRSCARSKDGAISSAWSDWAFAPARSPLASSAFFRACQPSESRFLPDMPLPRFTPPLTMQ